MNQQFKIYTGMLKTASGPNGKRFTTTASSTISDLAGDEITAGAIEKMAEKAKNNLTIFLNHKYDVPEDVLGSVTDTRMATRGVDSTGAPIVDLDFDIKLNESNPRAVQTWDAIEAGVKLGTSIGAIVRNHSKKKGGGIIIDDIDLLEASIVGIPANPRSWVQYAMKSLSAVPAADLEEALISIKGITDQMDLEKSLCPQCGGSKGMAKGGCPNDYHKGFVGDVDMPEGDVELLNTENAGVKKDADVVELAAEPDKEASRTRVTVTVDSEGTQEAPKSSPDPVLADETAEGDDALLGDTVTNSAEAVVGEAGPEVVQLINPKDAVPDVEKTVAPEAMAIETEDLASIVKNFQAAITKIADLQKALGEAESKRDEFKENLVVAKEIIDRIADLPIGQKTKFSGAITDFRTKFPQYDDEFMKFLEK